jgi:hypothetical protein
MKRGVLIALVVVVVAFRIAGMPAAPRARLARGWGAPEGRAWPPAVELVECVGCGGR